MMDDGAPTGPKTILRYFPERFRHHHSDRIRHVRRPNTNKITLAIRWRLGLTVCVSTCSRVFVCVYVRKCASNCVRCHQSSAICKHGRNASAPYRSSHHRARCSFVVQRGQPREIKRSLRRQHCSLPYLVSRRQRLYLPRFRRFRRSTNRVLHGRYFDTKQTLPG